MGNTYTQLGHEDIIKPFTINEGHLEQVLNVKWLKANAQTIDLNKVKKNSKPYFKLS
jgi:hypothetical protein